jgi:hypothetical protein
MAKINKVRYGGFSMMARVLWTLENLEGERITLPKIITNIDSVNLWTDEMSPRMKEWFKKKGADYMLTDRFKKEQQRYSLRQQQKQRDGWFNSDNAEKPHDWFNAEVLSPTGWLFVYGIATLYRVLMKSKASKDKKLEADAQIKKSEGFLHKKKDHPAIIYSSDTDDDEDDEDKESGYNEYGVDSQ